MQFSILQSIQHSYKDHPASYTFVEGKVSSWVMIPRREWPLKLT